MGARRNGIFRLLYHRIATSVCQTRKPISRPTDDKSILSKQMVLKGNEIADFEIYFAVIEPLAALTDQCDVKKLVGG